MRERQSSFAGGEFAPTLWGRTDYQRYATGLERLSNFFVGPHGEAINRPGTVHVDQLGGQGLLAPFVFSDDDAILLAFTDKTLRFYRYPTTGLQVGGAWAIVDAGGNPVQLVTPYTAATLGGLRFAQVGNTVTIVHPDNPPYELRRTSQDGTTWTLTQLDFSVDDLIEHSPVPAAMLVLPGNHRYSVPVWLLVQRIGVGGDGTTQVLSYTDKNHRGLEWHWAITRVWRGSDGKTHETMPYIIDSIDQRNIGGGLIGPPASDQFFEGTPAAGIEPAVAVYPDWSQTLELYYHPQFGAVGAKPDEVVVSRVYRGQAGNFGYIGQSDGTTFVDRGQEPDYSNPPPKGFNPFIVDGNTQHPRTVSFFEGRRVFGGTAERPATVFGSAIDDYLNFDEVALPDDSDALTFEIASNKSEVVRALVPARQLLALTSSAEWIITGSAGELVTPLSVSAHAQTEHGCADLAPVTVQDTVFFVQRKGTIPRALLFTLEGGGYQSQDISALSRHFFVGHTITAWAYAEDPYGILWVARDDGLLLSLTYSRDSQMIAWAQHQIAGGGKVESITTLPEGTEDGVYLLVNRGGVRAIERFASRVLTDVRNAVVLDACVVRGLDAEYATIVMTDAYAGGGAAGTYLNVAPGLGAIALGQVLQAEVDAGAPARIELAVDLGAGVFKAFVRQAVPLAMFGVEQFFSVCFNNVAGLGHLEGQQVTALLDGGVAGPFVVNGGGINLPDYVAIACVGLPYAYEMQSLEASEEKGKQKITERAWIEMEGARGGYAGSVLDGKLEEIRARRVAQNYGTIPLLRETFEVPVSDEWGQKGQIAFLGTEPVPVTILSLMREVKVGG